MLFLLASGPQPAGFGGPAAPPAQAPFRAQNSTTGPVVHGLRKKCPGPSCHPNVARTCTRPSVAGPATATRASSGWNFPVGSPLPRGVGGIRPGGWAWT